MCAEGLCYSSSPGPFGPPLLWLPSQVLEHWPQVTAITIGAGTPVLPLDTCMWVWQQQTDVSSQNPSGPTRDSKRIKEEVGAQDELLSLKQLFSQHSYTTSNNLCACLPAGDTHAEPAMKWDPHHTPGIKSRCFRFSACNTVKPVSSGVADCKSISCESGYWHYFTKGNSL
jgi:hypothetical protein